MNKISYQVPSLRIATPMSGAFQTVYDGFGNQTGLILANNIVGLRDGFDLYMTNSNPLLQKSGQIENSQITGFAQRNITNALVNKQQYSPYSEWVGNGWSTTNSDSRSVLFRQFVVPVQGAVNPTGYLQIHSHVNGVDTGNYFKYFTTGALTIPGTFTPGSYSNLIVTDTYTINTDFLPAVKLNPTVTVGATVGINIPGVSISPVITAGANNQSLYTLLLDSTLNTNSKTGILKYGIYQTQAYLNYFAGNIRTPILSLGAGANQLIFNSDSAFTGTLSWATSASNKTITFANNTGTVALLETASQTFTGFQLFSNGVQITSGQLRTPSGSAADPALWVSDGGTGTGIYSPSAGNLRIVCSTVIVAQFNSGGSGVLLDVISAYSSSSTGITINCKANITGAILTGSSALSLLNLTQTWITTGAPTAIKLVITNTASDAASLLLDLGLAGTGSKISVDLSGNMIITGSVKTAAPGGGGTAKKILFGEPIAVANAGLTALGVNFQQRIQIDADVFFSFMGTIQQ